jgi:NAD(P) transhydrogenase
MAASKYDLVVIGAGPAGEKGAAQAAYFGKTVAMIDPNPRPGGIAVSTAGIPTKVLREGAIYLSGLGQSPSGVPSPSAQDAWRMLMARKLEVSDFMTKAVERNLVRHRIDRIRGHACLLAGRRIEVVSPGGDRVTLDAEVVLIASGSRPFHPAAVPMDDPEVHDVETILGMDRVPDSMLVVGGGAAGCEYASIFAALGARVTLVDAGSQLLPALDVEMARVLAESFNGLGIRVIPLASVAGIARDGDELLARLTNGGTLRARTVLVAAGRRPSIEALGLTEAGVELNAAGWIRVDDRYATSVPGVFAAGDVVGPPALASVAMEQARVAVCHAFGFQFKTETDRFRPTYVFSIPEVAWVGLTEAQAAASGAAFAVGRSSFGTNVKARISGFSDGLVKLVFGATDKVLLGVHIVGELASELIHIGQLVLHEGGTIDRFIDTTFAVPTRSEAYKYAAYDGLARLSRDAERGRAR